jgi:hypothetical protein
MRENIITRKQKENKSTFAIGIVGRKTGLIPKKNVRKDDDDLDDVDEFWESDDDEEDVEGGGGGGRRRSSMLTKRRKSSSFSKETMKRDSNSNHNITTTHHNNNSNDNNSHSIHQKPNKTSTATKKRGSRNGLLPRIVGGGDMTKDEKKKISLKAPIPSNDSKMHDESLNTNKGKKIVEAFFRKVERERVQDAHEVATIAC